MPNQRLTPCRRRLGGAFSGPRKAVLLRLVLLMMPPVAVVSGCLGDPPLYEQPSQIPPFIIDSAVSPSLDVFHVVQPSTPINLTVPFRSEDLGENLEALVFFDRYPGREAGSPESISVGPGTLDQERPLVMQVVSPDTLGCHTMTLVLTHRHNTQGAKILDSEQAATVTWWLLVVDSGDTNAQVSVSDCPTEGGP